MKRNYSEMRVLFGDLVSYLARIIEPSSLDLSPELMVSVHDAADALLSMSGQTRRQRSYLAGLPFNVRLVLCMWLMDTEMAGKLIRAAKA